MSFDLRSRKEKFLNEFLKDLSNPIGFVDIGSGGPLKSPWNFLPDRHVLNYRFEPTDETDMLLCVSNTTGRAPFYVAHDERGSSLHRPLQDFSRRFGNPSVLTKKEIEVQLTTVDSYFENKFESIDCLDINVEGHDFQVLQGAEKLLKTGGVKLLKVEFETIAVWENQGWFSDIDHYLRSRGYELADIEIEYAPTAATEHICYRGEPLWGKAYYVPSQAILEPYLNDQEYLQKAIALLVAADLIGKLFDLLGPEGKQEQLKQRIKKVYRYAAYEKVVNNFKSVLKIR